MYRIFVLLSLLIFVSVTLGSPNFGYDGHHDLSKREITPGKHWFTVNVNKICAGGLGDKGPQVFIEVFLKDGTKDYKKITKTKLREISTKTFSGVFEMAFFINYTPKLKQLVELQIYYDADGTGKGPLYGVCTDVPIFEPGALGKEYDIVPEPQEDDKACGDEKPTVSFVMEK